MGWKFAAYATFIVALVSEFLIMLVLDAGVVLDASSQFGAIADGLALGVVVFAAHLAITKFNGSAGRKLAWSDWISALVLAMCSASVEFALHPLCESVASLEHEFVAEIGNAVLTAAVVGLLSGWLGFVEHHVREKDLHGGIGNKDGSSLILIGAIISASCIMGVATVREVNQGLLNEQGLVASRVAAQLARQRALSERVGRAVMTELLNGPELDSVNRALSIAYAVPTSFAVSYDRYLALNGKYAEHLQRMPSSASIRRAWSNVVSSAKAFSRGRGQARVDLAQRVENAIDELAPLLEQGVYGIDRLEADKVRVQGSVFGDTISSVAVFAMALGLLWPLVRLTMAQRLTLAKELHRTEKLNNRLSAYQHALDNHAIFAVTNRMGEITHVNENFCRISGYSAQELLGQNHRIVNSGTHAPEFFADLWAAIAAGKTWRYEVCNRAKDGGKYWVDTCIMPLLGADGKPEQFVSISYDITERKKSQIRASRRAQLELLIDDMRKELFASGAIYVSMSRLLEELNLTVGACASLVCEVGRTSEGQAWSLLLGHHRSVDGLAGPQAHGPAELIDVSAHPVIVQEVFEQNGLFGGLTVRQLGAQSFKGVVINAAYEPVGILLLSDNVKMQMFADEIQLITSALGDVISARRESDRRRNEEEKARKQAKRDPLTGLGNRRDLAEQFDARIDHPDAKFALLLVDLDRFKPVNDTYGHLIGDTVLRVVAERLRGCARGDVTVARIGGDEFALLTKVHAVEDEAGALALAQSILDELLQPIDCGGHSIQVGASVGVALYPRDGTAFQELLHRADAAMYRAKGNRSEAQVFNAVMDEAIRSRGELEADLKRAIDAGEIKPHFQPYVDLRNGRVAGHEILARWRHPRRGFVSPVEFIKIAEESGLVDRLFWQFLRDACGHHLSRGLDTILSINLSPTQIKNPTFAKQLIEELDGMGFRHELLEIEITETSMIGDIERARPLLQVLRSKGIRIALDDFGTGYSSLALLRNMPINKVKIDRSFVMDLEGSDGAGLTIVNAILGIAKALKLQVTAEGIETVKVSDFLRDMGCDYGQGYLFGRAEPELVTEPLIADAHPRLSVVAGGRRS